MIDSEQSKATLDKILHANAQLERERENMQRTQRAINKLFWACVACIALSVGLVGWLALKVFLAR